MGIARNLARVIADNSGAIAAGNLGNAIPADGSITTAKLAANAVTDAKIAAMAASKLTGTLPDANAPSGSVIQVQHGTTSTAVVSSTSTFTDTGIIATITPSNASNKIFVLININGLFKSASSVSNRIGLQLQRNSTVIDTSLANLWTNSSVEMRQSSVYNYVDTPNSTAALTYKLQFCNEQNVADVRIQRDGNSGSSSIILLEVTP
jgi:hypothetical protein